MDRDARINPYLAGNFAPIRSEDDFQLEVTGEMPAGLRGALYRTGPNPQFEPRDPNHHWFSGDGMVHGFFVENGAVSYRNRYVRTPRWEVENKAGKSLFGSFGNPMTTDPEVFGQDSGVANTNIVWHGGRLLALEEAHQPFGLDPKTLAPLGYQDFGGKVTAHPKEDPQTHDLVFFGYADSPMPFSANVSYGVMGADGTLKRRDTFEAPYCSMIHDFMVTKGHVLFPVLPLTGSMERAMGGKPAFAWEPEKPALVGVMARDAAVETIRWFQTDACYVFHVMNAWDEDGKIVADVMKYAVAPLFPLADGSRGQQAGAYLVRWTFDLNDASDAIKEEPLDDLAGEFPRFDERFSFKANRHGWFASQTVNPGDIRTNGLSHIDLTTGKRSDWVSGEGDAVSEPVFVPRTADAPEGDGWILAVQYLATENRSDMVVFDAQAMAAGPIGRAKMPRRLPFGFHGNWAGG
ncbi:MAG: carotenoid oxygenase family protein [Caulobacter sp.]|nr:carotenoid oxygenase family protein [Caulobacter sp.]